MKLFTLIAIGALSLTLHAQTVPLDHFDGGKNITQGSKVGSVGTLSEIIRSLQVSASGALTSANIVGIITNGDSTHAPSGDAVFDALALKQDAAKLVVYTSGASAGGAATEALTVTGLGASDTILAVTQSTAGANSTALISYGAPGSNSLTVGWTADPGAGAIVKVFVKKP